MEDIAQRKRIHAHLVGQLYELAPIGILATFINAAILVLVLWQVIGHGVLTVWLTATLLVAISRALLLYRYRRLPSRADDAGHWGTWYVASLILSGMLWGSAGVLLFSADSTVHQAFVAFVLCGMVAGAVGAFHAFLSAFVAFSLPALLPLLIRFSAIHDEIHYAMAGMTFLFMALTFFTARRISATNRESVTLRLRFSDLVRDRTAELETANAKLKAEILEREKVEDELVTANQLLETILATTHTLVAYLDPEFNFVRVNAAYARAKEREPAFFAGKNHFELYPDPQNEEIFRRVVETGEPHFAQARAFEYAEHLKRRMRHWDWGLMPVRGARGNAEGLVLTLVDVTGRIEAEQERRMLQERLAQAHKMETIATLAGGVAHQFNNALSVVTSYLELLEVDRPGDVDALLDLSLVGKAVDRMVQLTRQLLAYARGGKYQPRTLILSNFVRETLLLLRHEIGPSIEIESGLSLDTSAVKADPAQMQMVLTALLTNAAEALEGKGHVRVFTKNMQVDEAMAKKHAGLNPGAYVCLIVEDDGRGMDEETRSRVFEPFFTTKFQGRGLGMAAVYGIIKNHEGWISVESEPGRGTRVLVCLPEVEGPPRQAEEPAAEMVRGTETILLIEDEPMVFEAGTIMLERLGYRVLGAKTGSGALEIASTFDGSIDLALLDFVLPDMEGRDVYSGLMKARPGLKVILCSGFSIDGPAQEVLDAGAQGFLQKPFSVARLSEKLREALENSVIT